MTQHIIYNLQSSLYVSWSGCRDLSAKQVFNILNGFFYTYTIFSLSLKFLKSINERVNEISESIFKVFLPYFAPYDAS